MGCREKRGAHSRVGQLVGYLDLGCTRPQANPKHNWGALSPLVSFFLTRPRRGRRPCGLPDEFGLSPAWVRVICCLTHVARWLFKSCAMELQKAGLSCSDLQQGLHPGDAEAASIALLLGHAQGADFIFPGFTERSAGRETLTG